MLIYQFSLYEVCALILSFLRWLETMSILQTIL